MWLRIFIFLMSCCGLVAQEKYHLEDTVDFYKRDAVFIVFLKISEDGQLDPVVYRKSDRTLSVRKQLAARNLVFKEGEYLVFLYDHLKQQSFGLGRNLFSDSAFFEVINYDGKKFLSIDGLQSLDQALLFVGS